MKMKKYLLLILIIIIIEKINIIKCFEEISIEISIKEEEENGTMIIDLRSYIKSEFLQNNNSNGYIIRFVRPCLNLYIDKENSFKIRSFKIDREKLCPYEKFCYLNCDLFIEKEAIKLVKLKINIEDINDHKPKFKKELYSYELDENLLIGFRLQLEQAEDKCLIEINILENQQYNNLPPKFDLNLYKFFIFNLNETFIGKVHAKNDFNFNFNLNNNNNNYKQIYYRIIPSIENSNL
ncbi:unnamed protein product, partial [Rotaria sp. Silwood2]